MTLPDPTSSDLRARLEVLEPWAEASTGGDAIAFAVDAARQAPDALLVALSEASRVVIAGAGSSYYVAQIAAAGFREEARLPAVAVVLLRPRGVFGAVPAAAQPVIVISRSGTTSEAIAVAERVRAAGHPTWSVTGHPDSPMALASDLALVSPLAAEQSIVMTRSFGSMTALLLRLAARLAPDPRFAADLDALPAAWASTALEVEAAIGHAARNPSRVVVLGGGAAYGLANEAVLKITETGQVPANPWEPFEFRHGPMSVCEPGMLVIGILGGEAAEAEARVLDEAASHGADVWRLGPGDPGGHLGPIARLPLQLYPLQAFALSLALRRGLDPVTPRHLNQVVVLGEV
jgi:glucosamine--fructose-6-phosphate aminotransferase (isomerizing)